MNQIPMIEFDVAVERLGATAVVRVSGELDLATAPALRDAFDSVERPCDRVILDLSGLQFIDSTGIRMTLAEHERASADGFDLVVAGADGNVLKVLQLTGVDTMLSLAPDVTSALRENAVTASGAPRPRG